MPQLLEHDTVYSSSRSHDRRRTRRKLLAAAVGIAILVPVATQLVDAVPDWSNPFAQQVVDHSPAPLLLALQDLSQYHAATGTFQVVVPTRRSWDAPPSSSSPLSSWDHWTALQSCRPRPSVGKD